MKKVASLILVLLLVLSMAACSKKQSGSNEGAGNQASTKPETIYMTLATTPASSAMYPYCVGIAKAISQVYPEFQITTTEGTGALANTKLVRNGSVDVGTCVSNTDYENYNGTGNFAGDAFKDVRLLWYFDYTPLQIVVAEDSGITDAAGLEGKRFNAGGVGTSAEVLCMGIMDTLGIKPDYFAAGQSDAGEAYSGRQIVGVTKTGPAGDSYIVQLHASRKLRLLNFTQEEIDKVQAAFPYISVYTVPAGSYDGIDYDARTFQTFTGIQTTSKLPQEVGYKMIKAVMEDGKQTWASAYPLGENVDVLGILINDAVIPLHAGVVQYLEEKGYTVPANLIPPEYVKK